MSRHRLSNAKKGWDGAIQVAREEIEKLETSIRVFERNKANGEPWPRSQSASAQCRSACK
jgi:hypothetical protein